jgi:HAT1-interacting factor 1
VAQEQGEEEEDDDSDFFAQAFEILDMARVCFEKQKELPAEGDGKGKSAGDSPTTQHIKERLAETHALQGEISMEGEK